MNEVKIRKEHTLLYYCLIFLLYWTVLQEFFLSIFYKYTQNILITQVLFFSKDFLLIVIFVLSIIKLGTVRKRFYIYYVSFFSLLAAYLIYSFSISVSMTNIFASLRGLILFPIIVLAGFIAEQEDKLSVFIKTHFFNFLILCAILGIVEFGLDYIIGTKDIWTNTIGLGTFMADIKGQAHRLVFDLPGNFYGSYGNGFFSQKRLISLWAGPLTAAYVLVIPYMYFYLELYSMKHANYKKFLIVFILGIAIVMTFTRAIILPMIILSYFIFLIRFKSQKIKILSVIIIITSLFFLRNQIISYLIDGSTALHLEQFITSLGNISVFGYGLGAYGIYSEIGTESVYVSVWGQIGLFGLILYIIGFVYSFIKLYIAKPKYLLKYATLYLSIIFILTGLISEQLIAYTSVFPFYLILGISLYQTNQEVHHGAEDTLSQSHIT